MGQLSCSLGNYHKLDTFSMLSGFGEASDSVPVAGVTSDSDNEC